MFSLGKQGENIAYKYLKSKDFNIIKRNIRLKYGEIDIIFIDGNTLVFAEIKTRSSINKGYPYEAVNYNKLNKIKKCILFYLAKKPNFKKYRFDILSIIKIDDKYQINHLKNVNIGINL